MLVIYYSREYTIQEAKSNFISVFQEMPTDFNHLEKVNIDVNSDNLFFALPTNSDEIGFKIHGNGYVNYTFIGLWSQGEDVYAIHVTLEDDYISEELSRDLKHMIQSIASHCE